MPLEQWQAQGGGHFFGKHGLAGPRLTLDQERALQGDRGVDGEGQVAGGDVGVGTFEFHFGILKIGWRCG